MGASRTRRTAALVAGTLLFFVFVGACAMCVSGDCRDGKGKRLFTDGTGYEGEFRAGLYHGRGKLEFMDRSHYEGEFREGLANGSGVFVFSNGDRYVGQFKDGKRHGQGVMTRADGTVEDGKWEKNRFLGEAR